MDLDQFRLILDFKIFHAGSFIAFGMQIDSAGMSFAVDHIGDQAGLTYRFPAKMTHMYSSG